MTATDQPSALQSWFSPRVCAATLVALLGMTLLKPYIDLYLHLELAFLMQLPFGCIFYIALIAAGWNPLMQRIWPAAVLNGRELIATLVLSMCMVWASSAYPGSQMIATQQAKSGEVMWEKHQLLEQVPSALYPLGGDHEHPDYELVYDNYAQGLTPGQEIPWQHWLGPLANWMPLYLLFAVVAISMAWLVHRQWSRNEQLNYPLAQIAHQLFDKQQQRSLPDIFYARQMWIAACLVFAIHAYGIFITWFPGALPPLELHARFNFLWNVFIILNRTGAWWLTDFHIMFSVIGLTYFLGREAGLTLALSQVLLLLFSIQFYLNTGSVMNSGHIETTRSGAYIAYGLIILYTGRFHYIGLLKKAFGAQNSNEISESAWLVRIFLSANLLLYVYLLYVFEMDYLIAALLIAVLLLCMLVFARLVCELGGPYIQGQWGILSLFSGVLGPAALGPSAMMGIIYVSQALSVHGNAALMPFISNGLQLTDKAGMKPRGLFSGMTLVTCICILLSTVCLTSYFYTYGAQTKYAHQGSFISQAASSIRPAKDAMERLDEFGQVDLAAQTHGVAKLGLISPDTEYLSWLSIGAIGVCLFFFLRIRVAWWPLHPMLFLVWDTFPVKIFYWSFFFGWCCKEIIIRFGGGNIYQKAKPFFIGLIVGDIIAFIATAAVAAAYVLITGDDPVVYRVYRFF